MATDFCLDCIFKDICKREDAFLEKKTTHQHQYKKNEIIFKQGLKSNYLVYLTKGIVKFNYIDHTNKNLILTITSAPTLLGLANILNEGMNIFSIIAVEDSVGCHINFEKFIYLAMHDKEIMKLIIDMSSKMFRTSIFNFISLAHKQVNGRLADILLHLSRNVYACDSFRLSISRKELAEYAGCSKEIIIRTLRDWDQENIILIKGKKLKILDERRLVMISRTG